MAAAAELACPMCGSGHAPEERFCRTCGVPLVLGPSAAAPADPRQLQVRKIKPQLAEGPLMRVAGARNQAEAEFIQGLLLEEGVPSLLRRTAGFDVPDFLAAGPRDVLVAQSGAAAAREVLLQAEVISESGAPARVRPARLLAGLVLALAVGAAVIWVVAALLGLS